MYCPIMSVNATTIGQYLANVHYFEHLCCSFLLLVFFHAWYAEIFFARYVWDGVCVCVCVCVCVYCIMSVIIWL